MNLPQIITDNERKVKDALEIWANWMQRPNKGLGYGRCMGFDGVSNTSGWDDFEHKVDKNMAINVQAIYEGLRQPQQIAIDHFHLSAVWRSNRGSLEDDYATALVAMEIGLRRRGMI